MRVSNNHSRQLFGLPFLPLTKRLFDCLTRHYLWRNRSGVCGFTENLVVHQRFPSMPDCGIELKDIIASIGINTMSSQFITYTLGLSDIFDRDEVAGDLHGVGLIANLIGR
jgi:hypothetical protein